MMTSMIVLVGIIATVVVPAAADCLVGGDMMFVEGQSTGHIGLECLNSTHYDARASVCGPNGQLVDSEVVYQCPDSVQYCMQCGSRGVGAALCLSVPDLGNRNCNDDSGGVGGGGNQDEDGELVIDFNDGSTTPNDNDSDGGFVIEFNDPDPIVDDNNNGGDIVLIENDNDGGGCDMMCPMDVEECDDGSYVSRDPCNDCQFEECEDEGFLPEDGIGITQDPGPVDTEPIEPFDLCDNPSDIDTWTINGGESSRPAQSQYCFEEYNDSGCGMDNDCLTKCWMDTYGYSEDCVACFVSIHQCSMDNGCMDSCSEDMTGEECLECNVPCIEKMFGCSGLPQVVDETVTDPTLPEMINPGEESTNSPTTSGDDTNAPTSSPGDSETFTFAPVNPSPTQPTDRDNSGASGNNQLIALSLVVLGMMIV